MDLKELLTRFKKGDLELEEVLQHFPSQGLEELGYAVIDTDRERRTGMPEVIYGLGKSSEQICGIAGKMLEKGIDVFVTRISPEAAEALLDKYPEADYNQQARTLVISKGKKKSGKGYIAVVAAGTSDLHVAEEAAITAEFLGQEVERIFDVGVAGIHRLFNRLELIRNARVIIVVAGMEGALTSVVAGLVNKPVIGVPTSVGYGANFQGLSALLAMLNSCSTGVSVVNIDNGFGAGCQAALISNT